MLLAQMKPPAFAGMTKKCNHDTFAKLDLVFDKVRINFDVNQKNGLCYNIRKK